MMGTATNPASNYPLSDQCNVMFIANEPPWPTRNGGRVRMAGIVDALRQDFDVGVVAPRPRGAIQEYPAERSFEEIEILESSRHPHGIQHFVSRKPRLGNVLLPGHAREQIKDLAIRRGCDVAIFSHSYIAFGVDPRVYTIVDFPNIEMDRARSIAGASRGIHRYSALFEATKAKRWEPRVARAADLCLACTESELEQLERWGARAVLVPHGSWAVPAPPSPPGGYVLLFGSGGYQPNVDGVNWMLGEIWPRVLAAAPGARLVIAGSGTRESFGSASALQGVSVIGRVEELAPLFREAAVVAAPVRSGGGAQLKVIDALAHGRVIVASFYSARSAPPGCAGVKSADTAERFAHDLMEMLTDVPERHALERGLKDNRPVMSWTEACRPLAAAIKQLRS